MRIFNPDGSEAEMCGNGLRCVAWYLHTEDHGKRAFAVETGAGIMETTVVGRERIRISMAMPRGLRLGIKLTVKGASHKVDLVDTGVPHAILWVPSLEQVDPASLGPVIRFHKFFQSSGTNVDWVRTDSPHQAAIRTYERGVEAETLACGTGAVAAVVIGIALGRLRSPVQVMTAGGESLGVGFNTGFLRLPAPRTTRQADESPEAVGSRWEGLYLEGPARILFKGVISP
jgi:diaminopimelate epimerase